MSLQQAWRLGHAFPILFGCSLLLALGGACGNDTESAPGTSDASLSDGGTSGADASISDSGEEGGSVEDAASTVEDDASTAEDDASTDGGAGDMADAGTNHPTDAGGASDSGVSLADAGGSTEPADAGTSITPVGPNHGVVGVEAIEAWDQLASDQVDVVKQARVFFGHQSVGWNIINGIEALGGFNVHQTKSKNAFTTAIIGHDTIGSNEYPFAKVDDFKGIVSNIGDNLDIAVMKFCWIDFSSSLDIEGLKNKYVESVSALKAEHPNITFLHITPPLTTDEASNNALRLAFGEWLKSTYSADAIVLDLASVESTEPQGGACQGAGYARLCDTYAEDHGHLNDLGRRRAAKAMLYALRRSL